jgi:membrane-associated phospholipid phosphatase
MRDRPANTQAPRTPPARFGRRALLSFVTVFAAAVGFAILLLLVKSKSTGLLHIDNTVADELHEYVRSHRTFTSAMRLVSDLGTSVAWWIILIPVVGWLAYRRLPRLAAFVLVTAIGSSLLNNAIKLTVNRARPHLADPVAIAGGRSFPSGHAQAAIVGYGILLLVFLPVIARRARPWVMAVASSLVLLIGFSRIALGVHYFSDVIGGFLIGGAWLFAMTAAFSAWRIDEANHPFIPLKVSNRDSPSHPDVASRSCRRSWAASSMSLCRHSDARYTQAISAVRCTRRKSPYTNPYRPFVSSLAPSVRPRCQAAYSSHECDSRNAVVSATVGRTSPQSLSSTYCRASMSRRALPPRPC